MEFWELELQQIEETASLDAMADLWAEVLAGLGGAEDSELDRLALKAQALAEGEDPEMRAYLENRIDEIVYARKAERMTGARGRRG